MENTSISSYKKLFIVLCASLLFFYEFVQTNIFSTINVYIAKDFQLNSVELGYAASIYFYSSMLLMPFAGLLLDIFSPKKLIIFAMISCLLGVFGMSISHSFDTLLISRFISGIGNAFSLIACAKLISIWTDSKNTASSFGYCITMAMLGGITAQLPARFLVNNLGWRPTLMIDTLLGILLLILMVIFIKEKEQVLIRSESIKMQLTSITRLFKLVLSNINNWYAAIYTCLMNLPIFILGAVWGSLYLQHVYLLSAKIASSIISMLFLGTLMGCLFIGKLSDKLNNRRIIMIIGTDLSIIIFAMIIFLKSITISQLYILFLMLGITSSAQILSYAYVTQINPKSITATSNSLVSMSALLGAIIGQPLFGYLINENTNKLANFHSNNIYMLKHFNHGMIFILVCFFIALFCAYKTKHNAISVC